MMSNCGFNLHFHMANNVEHISICHLYIIFTEMSLHVFCPFSNWIVCFLLLIFESSLWSFADVWFAILFVVLFGLQTLSPSLYLFFRSLTRMFRRTEAFKV